MDCKQHRNECAARAAGELFGNGFHCAEAVAKAALEALGRDAGESVAAATPFGGGVGKSFEEVCGALSGALIAIGQLHGRRRRAEDWDYPAGLGVLVRQAFMERHGTTTCGELRERFGSEAQMRECRKIVRQCTLDVLEALDVECDAACAAAGYCPDAHAAPGKETAHA